MVYVVTKYQDRKLFARWFNSTIGFGVAEKRAIHFTFTDANRVAQMERATVEKVCHCEVCGIQFYQVVNSTHVWCSRCIDETIRQEKVS